MHTHLHPVHVVTSLHKLSGVVTHANALVRALRIVGKSVFLWSDTPGAMVATTGGLAISPFSGQMPRGGTLILLGAFVKLEPWISYARPERLVVVCCLSNPAQLFALLGQLQRPGLPPVELSYISSRLRDVMQLPGRISPEIVDLNRFTPNREGKSGLFTVGRLSRDTLQKHHPDDPSLYRLLAWQGVRIRIMGGTCLHGQFAGIPNIELLPEGAEPAEDFLRSLDVFFYHTAPDWHEPSGRVVMEALACGLPVVAHVSGGYTDWIQSGHNGFLFSTQEEALRHLEHLRTTPCVLMQQARNARGAAEKIGGSAACMEYLNWLSHS